MPSRPYRLVRASVRLSRQADRADDWKLYDNLGGPPMPLAERGISECTDRSSPGELGGLDPAGTDLALVPNTFDGNTANGERVEN